VAPLVSKPRTAWSLDWAIGSVALSIAGAAMSLVNTRLFWVGVIVFVLGLITGAVALRKGGRRNVAAIGIILNAANLAFDAALVLVAGSR
jgi:hypothetical protein